VNSSERVFVAAGVSAGYGSMPVVRDVSLTVSPGEIVALIGRNGAGKTTTLLALGGLRYGGWSGSVQLGEADLSRLNATQIVGRGVALVPEGHRIFRTLTVAENLRMGATPIRSQGPAAVTAATRRVFELFPVLQTYRDRNAGYLSGGEQQMIAIGQALMARPAVLLLDEPTSGIAPALIREIYDALEALRADGMAILIVEQSVERALSRSDRYYVMEQGQIARTGRSDEPGAAAGVAAIVRGVETAS
jgi:branched-chain amino acid transport system ATP-binding protein